jgi:hypothetical protein
MAPFRFTAIRTFNGTVTAFGRQNAATNDRFREAKLRRPLSGDELEETSVASRP